MAHAYDDGLPPAAGCRGIRTVDATISRFIYLLSLKLDCYAAILLAQA